MHRILPIHVLILLAPVLAGCRTMHIAEVKCCMAEPAIGAPRGIFIPDVPNARDLGGWKTEHGRYVKYGMIYRSSAFDRKPKWYDFSFRPQISPGTTTFLREKLKIKTDIDLRGEQETCGMECSPLGREVRWMNIPMSSYDGIVSEEGKAAFARLFRVLLNESNYPIVIHCQFGRDRAGTVAFLINGLLGVPLESLCDDWEMSLVWYNSNRYSRKHCTGAIISVMAKYHGDTFSDKVRSYVRSLGFSDEEISRFVALMTTDEPNDI